MIKNNNDEEEISSFEDFLPAKITIKGRFIHVNKGITLTGLGYVIVT